MKIKELKEKLDIFNEEKEITATLDYIGEKPCRVILKVGSIIIDDVRLVDD